tara:strand:+ start:343 stop:4224 length:3882 start_codon:yes stop_codon:yes gene_type:complete
LALLIPPFLANAFERMGAGNKSLESVAVNTRQTAASVSVGGDLYKKMDELVKALKGGTGRGGGKVSIKEALVLRITAGALEPIGLGLGIIIDSLNRAPDGKELKLKMEALTNGLLALGDVGWAILKFAGLMILALPLLILAGVAMLVIVPLLKLMVDGLMWATKKLDKKGLKNIIALGEVGKALLILSASLVLMALLTPLILKGLLVAGVVLLGFGLMLMLLGKMGLDTKAISKFGKALGTLALALFGLSLTLILMGLLAMPILAGLATAALVLLTIGGVFWLLDFMKVDKSMRKTGIALMFAAGAILSVAIALVLSHLILSSVGFEEVAKVMLIVGAVAAVFGVIGLAAKKIKKGALAMIFAAGAILALTIAIYLMQLVLGDMSGEDVINSFKVLAVIAGVGIVMGVAGLAAKQIKKGSIAMIFAAVAMVAMALGTYVMLAAVGGASWEEIGMMGAVIAGAAIAFGVAGAGPIPMAIALGSAAMILAGVAMIVIGAGTLVMMKAVKGATWDEIGMMGAVIAGVGIAMGVAGLAAPFIALGSAAMILAGGAIYAVSLGVQELNKLPIADMFANGGLFGDSGTVTKGFLGIGGGRPMTNMEVMFEAIANSFSLGPLQLLALYATSPALILAGLALISIGKGLQEFQKIAADTDLALLGINVTVITTILANAFGEIGKKFPGGAAGLFTSGSFVSQGITSVLGMGDALTSIAMGMQQMANLKFPTKYDKDGKPIAFESMDSDAPVRVAANTMMIVDGLSRVFGEVGKLYPKGKASFMNALIGNGGQSPVEVGIESVMGMGGALTSVSLGFQAMANLRFPIAWDAEGKPTSYAEVKDLGAAAQRVADNTKLIVTSLSGTFAEIGAGKTSSWWQGDTDYEKGVDVVAGLGTPLKNLAEGVAAMADMKFATGYDAEGKATGWINLSAMTPEEIKAKLGKNTQTLVTALTDVFSTIGGGKSKTSSWWQGSTTFEKGVKLVEKLGKPYKTLAGIVKSALEFLDKPLDTEKLSNIALDLFDIISNIGLLDKSLFYNGTSRMNAAGKAYTTFSGNIEEAAPAILEINAQLFKDNISTLVSTLTTIGGSTDPVVLNAAKLLSYAIGSTYKKMSEAIPIIVGATNKFNPINGTIMSGLLFGKTDTGSALAGYNAQTQMQMALATTYGKAGENFPKIQGAINALDLTKLTESRKMFEALAVLSNGGSPGDVLAQMGESLEAALQNLATMLNDFKDTVKEGNEEQGGIISKIGDTISKVTGIGGKKGNDSGSKPAAAAMPTKMEVTIAQSSIDKLTSGGFNFGSGE